MVEREQRPNPEIPARPHEHSVGMSKRLLGNDIEGTAINHTIGTEIHDTVYKAFEAGSIDNRKHYWEKRNVGNWGEQMLVWLQGEDGNGGLSGWIREQNTLANESGGEDLKRMLSYAAVAIDKNRGVTGHPLVEVVERMNESLKAAGIEPLDINSLNNEMLGALSFYSIYLNPDKGAKITLAKLTQDFIGKLIEGATYDLPQQIPQGEETEYQERIFKRLALLTPLFRTTGLDAQYGLSAMVAAKVHAATKKADVEAADHTNLNKADERALDFFEKYKVPKTSDEGPIPEGTFDAGENLPDDDMPEFPSESEITVPQDLVRLYQDVPEFNLDGQVLDPDQKEGLQRILESIRISQPLTHTITLDEKFVDSQLEHSHPFFAHHQDIVPLVYLLVNRHATGQQNPDQNPTLNKGESIFDGQQNFFTGLAALMGEEIKDPKLRAETQASAVIVLADAILQIYRQGGPNWLKVLVETQMNDLRNQWMFIGHDLERRVRRGDDTEIERQVVVFEKAIQGLREGDEIPQSEDPSDILFAIIKRTPTQDNPYPLEIDVEKTVERLWERVKTAFDTTFEGKLTPQDAMLVEFLGNGLYVEKLAEAIAAQQRKEQQAA